MKKPRPLPEPKPNRILQDIKSRIPAYSVDTVFDVGANLGQSAVSYALHSPNAVIHSFEPIAKTYELLVQNVATYPNIQCHSFGLGDNDHTLRALSDGTSAGNRIVSSESSDLSYEDVKIVRGDDYCREQNIQSINFLKIDTEGHDMAVLNGFGEKIKKIDFIQVEASMNPQNKLHIPFRDLEDYIRGYGFLIFKIYGQVFEFHDGGKPYARRGDFVFVNERLAGV